MLSRNAEIDNWGVPTLEYNRNVLELEYNHKTTFNAGDLVPFYVNTLVQPGDTIKMNMSFVIRMLTPYFPVMDNAYIDFYFFADSWLDCFDHAKEFFGEDLMQPFESATEYTIPIVKSASSGTYGTLGTNTILDHMGGLPIGTAFESDRLGLNCYLRVWNQNFRDQNLMAPITVDTSDSDVTYDGTSATGGTLLKVSKSHDYFTSALIEPMKGVALTIPVGTTAEVYTTKHEGYTLNGQQIPLIITNNVVTTPNTSTVTDSTIIGGQSGTNGIGNILQRGAHTSGTTISGYGLADKGYRGRSQFWADLSTANGPSLTAERAIVAMTQIQEKMMIMGSRYREWVRWGFGVTTPSLSLHEAKYLGGKRVPINIDTVLDATNTDDNLGDTGAYSITADADYMFTESFDQHSIILGVFCVRCDQTYSQGIDCQHSKRRRYDYYHNELKGLGMQPIYNKEIMVTGTNDEDVWGYKPAWQEYRNEINHVTGLMRPNAANSLSKWTYANNFATRPSLNDSFLYQGTEQIANTIKDTNKEHAQFFADINLQYVKVTEVPRFAPVGLDRF